MRQHARAHFWCRMRTHGVRRQRGSTYAIALIVLTVLGTLATMLGWSALMQSRQAQAKETQLRLDSLLASGVTYACWARCYQGRNLPFTFTLNLSEGRVVGRVSQNKRYGDNAMEVRVTATYKDHTKTLTRIIDGSQKARSTTEFALFLDEELVVDGGRKLTLKGDLRANNNIQVKPGGTLSVQGAVSTSRQIITGTLTGFTATLYMEQWAQVMPDDLPDIGELYSQATQVVAGNQNLPFGLTLTNKSVYYVQGNLQIQGALKGCAIIVAEGNIVFTGDTSYADNDSLFVFFAEGNIEVPDNARVSGLLISLDGNVKLGNRAQVNGGIIILDGDLQLQGEAQLEHDPRINADLFRELTRLQETTGGLPVLVPFP